MLDKCQVKCLVKCLAKAKCWSKCPASIYKDLALILILDRSAKLKKKPSWLFTIENYQVLLFTTM